MENWQRSADYFDEAIIILTNENRPIPRGVLKKRDLARQKSLVY